MDIVINSTCPSVPDCEDSTEIMGHFYSHVLTCLGYTENAPPVADLLRRYHGLIGRWLVISPIYWQATHNDAMIMACYDALGLSDTESKRWFAALAAFLAADPVKLHYHDAYTWLIQFDNAPLIRAEPVHLLFNQSIKKPLHELDATLFWSRFITENQMFFSEHPLNKERSGLYPVNGVWIWGEGELSAPETRPIVYADDKTHVLAQLLSSRVSRLQSSQALSDNSLVLLSDFDNSLMNHSKKNTVRWFWNNRIYMTKKPSIWTRLFNQLFRGV